MTEPDLSPYEPAFSTDPLNFRPARESPFPKRTPEERSPLPSPP